VEFALPGLELAALEWGEPGDFPVLALHGWLDNAGSFDLLAPRLTGCHIVAPDAAGHGKSGFRSPDAGYNIWQDVRDVLGIAEHLGWGEFALLGHSRGATIATLTAGSFPERVSRLVLIEGGVPPVGNPSDAPRTLAESIVEAERLRGRSGGRVFETRDLAIEERCKGFTSVSREAAEILARRSLRAVEGGFQWRVDQRLKAPSEIRLGIEQLRAFIAAVESPVLAFFAERSPFASRPQFRSLLAGFARMQTAELAGGHHCHLEGAEEEIARETLRFFGCAP
jgi:pimeloyl-ACP methyl ester carboxylesterase